ncbi:MAG: hypothetical protein IKQ29_01635 [Bacilli bacterium]|nr:hypothetical protein [Bacilli bacterium]
MKKFKNIVYRCRLKGLLLRNSIYRKNHSFDKELIIASSDKYANRVKEDINLCYYLMKDGINSNIMSYKDIKCSSNVIVRSVWGYQNDLVNFNNFITHREGITINSSSIIENNISKENQYNLFKKYNIDCIDTKFIYDKKDIVIDKKSVLKPIISASGNNTYIINDIKDVDKIEDINKGYMLQPFIEDINNGEYSIILFNKKIMYGIKRFPGVFTDRQSVEYINKKDLNKDIINIIDKVNKIDEYKDYCFMRVDIVNNMVLELELIDPQLFIETIPNEEERVNIYKEFVNCIKDKLK